MGALRRKVVECKVGSSASPASSFGGFGGHAGYGFELTFGGSGGGGSGNLAGSGPEWRCWVEVYPLELQLAGNSNLQDVRKRQFSKSDSMQHIQNVMRTEFDIHNSEV